MQKTSFSCYFKGLHAFILHIDNICSINCILLGVTCNRHHFHALLRVSCLFVFVHVTPYIFITYPVYQINFVPCGIKALESMKSPKTDFF